MPEPKTDWKRKTEKTKNFLLSLPTCPMKIILIFSTWSSSKISDAGSGVEIGLGFTSSTSVTTGSKQKIFLTFYNFDNTK